MTAFRHLGDDPIAELDRIKVFRSRFAAPDGTTFVRDVVRNLAVVAVVPVLDDGESVLMVRQYRGPIDRELLEIPAGLCDVPGEPLLDTAARELVEEIGRTADQLELVAGFYPSPGFSDQFVHLYVGTGLREVPLDRQGPEESHMTMETIRLVDVPAMIADQEITDAKSVLGLLLVRDRLRR